MRGPGLAELTSNLEYNIHLVVLNQLDSRNATLLLSHSFVYISVKLDWLLDKYCREFQAPSSRSTPLQRVKFWATKGNPDEREVKLCRSTKDVGRES